MTNGFMTMELQLKGFEEYVAALSALGVYPTLNRYQNGWTCVLRNNLNRQLMPLDGKDHCWAETMLGALTDAVELLNQTFPNPKELHAYITSGKALDEARSFSNENASQQSQSYQPEKTY